MLRPSPRNGDLCITRHSRESGNPTPPSRWERAGVRATLPHSVWGFCKCLHRGGTIGGPDLVIAAKAATQGHASAPLRALHPLSKCWRGDGPKPHHTWHYPCGFGPSEGRGGEARLAAPSCISICMQISYVCLVACARPGEDEAGVDAAEPKRIAQGVVRPAV